MTNEPNKTTDLRHSQTYSRLLQDREGDLPLVPWVIEFRVVGTPHIIRAPMGKTLLMGRSDVERRFTPDIDLEGYLGQTLGVSRRHAQLVAQDNRITIEDLKSANGTFINGEQILPQKPYRIYEGDVLMLGELKLQVHFVVKPVSHDQTQVGIEEMLHVQRVAQGQKLLVVDDSYEVSALIRTLAKRAGFDVQIANTLSEAISMIDGTPPQGIIVELMLPDGNGKDLIRYYREKTRGQELPIVAIAEATAGFKMGEALTHGADMFLGKPLSVEELVSALVKMATMMPT